MKKLIVAVAVTYAAFTLARLMPSAGFYVMLLLALIGFLIIRQHYRANVNQSRDDRARKRQAEKAVRAGMTYAQASQKYGVSERAIRRRRLQLFDLYFD